MSRPRSSSLPANSGIPPSASNSSSLYSTSGNGQHFRAVADAGIEWLELDYAQKTFHYKHEGRVYFDSVIEQAFGEWSFWDGERRLQDSVYSPNLKAKGPCYVLAHGMAERWADVIAV